MGVAILGIAPVVGDALGRLLKAGKLKGVDRAEFDALDEVQGLSAAQKDQAYVEFVIRSEKSLGIDVPVQITKHSDGSYRTPDGKFASQGGVPVPGSRSAQEYTQFLREKGFNVIGEELSVNAPIGTRRYDAVIRDNKGELWGIEYKSGTARKTPQQDFNDMYINRFGADGIGKIEGQNVVGNMTIYLP